MSIVSFLDILDRAHSGPICKVKEWDTKVVPNKIKEKLQKFGLEKTCTPEEPINTDDGLADSFFHAGLELAADVGVLCLSTQRVIKFTEEELRIALDKAPHEASLGLGQDRVVIRNRKPEDGRLLATWLGPFGQLVDEDLYISVCQSAAQYRSIDCLIPACLATVYGRPFKTKTPYETLGGKVGAELDREAVRRAGRVGMPIEGISSSPSEYGHFGGYGCPGGLRPDSDIAVVLGPAELKIDYAQMHKLVHTLNHGGQIYAGHWSFIGGYAGPPEGTVVASIAALILQIPVFQATHVFAGVLDIRNFSNDSRDALWASSVSWQAQSRNTHALVMGGINPVAGPCTHMILYEASANAINSAVSGCASVVGVRSIQIPNHVTGLESGFAGEVAKASCGLTRVQANDIVKEILPKYEEKLKSPPKGKPFQECFDVKTLKPSKEWTKIYLEVKAELSNLGIPLKEC